MVPHELAGCAEIVEGAVMDKERKAIERLRLAAQMSETYYEQPLIITTSGGQRLGRLPASGRDCGH